VGDVEAGLELLVRPPCVLFEDDHLLVVNKPAGLNTHAPSPFAGEGLYEWLRHRERRWASLAIIHRLDKETSGILVFSKTPQANRSLTQQFTARTVRKKYILLTDRTVPATVLEVKSGLVRCGDKYISRQTGSGGDIAHTRFNVASASTGSAGSPVLVQAEPLTGRTHQIRVHAADRGFPIVGDTRYGGTPGRRLCLHAAELQFQHPASGKSLSFHVPHDFVADPALTLRRALIPAQSTNAFRLLHGATDNWPGCYVDALGSYLLVQTTGAIDDAAQKQLAALAQAGSAAGIYEKRLYGTVPGAPRAELSPKLLAGTAAPEYFSVLENDLKFQLSFNEGYSVGLFLDQRDSRRRLISGHIAAEFPLYPEGSADPSEVLNTFAYTCGFSVCAAKSGARTTSLDLSKKYLEWGKENFRLNQIDPAGHDFVFGDVFDWLRRFRKKGRLFDVVILDPPTFSRSKEYGPFRVEKDYGHLVSQALPLLRPGGVLFASCNSATWLPEAFIQAVQGPIRDANRSILQQHYFPQPPDFPISRGEPGYLKTLWLRVQ
jgi:23S rRNA (cytosine1962-C5)-methyltransferase